MKMDQKELKFILQEGEGLKLEFKEDLDKSIAKEIVSPGGLPKGLDKKDFGKISVRRNQVISDIFSKTPYVEQIGSGITRMNKLLKKSGLPSPVFEMTNFFVVYFKRKEPLKRQDKIVKFVRQHDKVKRNDLVANLGISFGTLKKDLAVLVSKGIIKKVASKKQVIMS